MEGFEEHWIPGFGSESRSRQGGGGEVFSEEWSDGLRVREVRQWDQRRPISST